MNELANQVDRNFEAFRSELPTLLQSHPGKFALLHDAQVVGFFETAVLAFVQGIGQFGVSEFSVQEVTGEAENLGFYSYAGSPMQA